MKCPECTFDNPPGMKFCGECGTNLGESKSAVEPQPLSVVCSNCGAEMPSDAAYCGACGNLMKTGAASDQPMSVQEDDHEGDSAAIRRASGQTTFDEPTVAPPSAAATCDPPEEPTTAGDQSEVPNVRGQGAAIYVTERRNAEAEIVSPNGSLREMVLVPSGWFAMGTAPHVGKEDEHPQHQVELGPYYIDRCAISNLEYERFQPGHRRVRPPQAAGDEDPVVFVSYQDCLGYCRWRSQQEGVPENTYSLPTEAQWERAARGGFPDRIYPWGDEIILEACNTLEARRGRTVPVDEGLPNGFVLFHMGSNVREWCFDFYGADYYSSRAATGLNPKGPNRPGAVKMNVVRGASFQDSAEELGRCAARNYGHPNHSSNDTGFRCVRAAD